MTSLTVSDQTWKAVLEWKVEPNKTARILRSGNKLMIESEVNKQKVREPYEQPIGETVLSPDEIITRISKRQAYINEDGTVDFLIKAIAKSQLNNVTIDQSSWGVTLVDVGRSKSKLKPTGINPFYWDIDINPLTWSGHAVIIIETVEKGVFHMWRAEVLGDENDEVICLFKETSLDELRKKNDGTLLSENFPRSKTWIKTKSLVLKMMGQISRDVANYNKEHGESFNALFLGDAIVDRPRYEVNCIEWAKRTLLLANITVPFSWTGSLIISTPSAYISRSVMHKLAVSAGVIAAAAFVWAPVGFLICSAGAGAVFGGSLGGIWCMGCEVLEQKGMFDKKE